MGWCHSTGQTFQERFPLTLILQVSEPDKPTINATMEVNSSILQPEPEHEQGSETENLDASAAQDKDSLVLIVPSDTVHESSAEETDGLAIPTLTVRQVPPPYSYLISHFIHLDVTSTTVFFCGIRSTPNA